MTFKCITDVRFLTYCIISFETYKTNVDFLIQYQDFVLDKEFEQKDQIVYILESLIADVKYLGLISGQNLHQHQCL